MFKNTPFESIAKTLSESAPKLDTSAMLQAFGPMQDNLKEWADLAQSQAQDAQATLVETVQAYRKAQSPQDAMEVAQKSATAVAALFSKNAKEISALSFEQFRSNLETVERTFPMPQALGFVTEGLKSTATTVENTLNAALEKCTPASTAPTAKKAR